MSGHAKFAPSSADAWDKCSMFITMQNLFPSVDTDDTLEGEAAHEVATTLAANLGVESPHHRPGMMASNGVMIDEEMMRGARLFSDFADELFPSAGIQRMVEQRLPAGSFGPNNWGTPDLFGWSSRFRLDVVDYKYGHGFVPATTLQLVNYAGLICDWYNVDGAWQQELVIGMHVVQPRNYDRAGPIRSRIVKASDLRAEWNGLRAAIERDPSFTRTGEHCRHCPGARACHAAQRAGFNVADVSMLSEPFNLPGPQLGAELTMLKRARTVIDARIRGLEDEAIAMCERGDHTHGFDLERARGRLAWTVPVEKVIEQGRLFGLDLAGKPAALTPTQAKNAGMPADIVDSIARRSAGEPSLVPLDESPARKVFGHNV